MATSMAMRRAFIINEHLNLRHGKPSIRSTTEVHRNDNPKMPRNVRRTPRSTRFSKVWKPKHPPFPRFGNQLAGGHPNPHPTLLTPVTHPFGLRHSGFFQISVYALRATPRHVGNSSFVIPFPPHPPRLTPACATPSTILSPDLPTHGYSPGSPLVPDRESDRSVPANTGPREIRCPFQFAFRVHSNW